MKKESQGNVKESLDREEFADDHDDAAGKASLEKYTSGQTKVGPINDPKLSVHKQDNAGSPSKSTAFGNGSPSKRLANDSYYHGLQDFVDMALKSIAAKIAEKKSVEMDTSSLKIVISKIRDDLKKEDQMQKIIKRNTEQENETCRKRIKENEGLLEMLKALKEKADAKRAEIAARITEAEAQYNKLRESIAEEKNKVEAVKQQIDLERVETKNEIRVLEQANADAINELDEYRRRIEHQRIAEHERVKMLRQKSKVLASLIGQEATIGKSPLHKDISKILRSPVKQSSIMQTVSRTLSKT